MFPESYVEMVSAATAKDSDEDWDDEGDEDWDDGAHGGGAAAEDVIAHVNHSPEQDHDDDHDDDDDPPESSTDHGVPGASFNAGNTIGRATLKRTVNR